MDIHSVDAEMLRLTSNSELKLSVVRALDELMREESIDRISVAKICSLSGISRATFYRYFNDKFAIVEWYLRYIYARSVDRIGRTMSWYEGYFTCEALISNNMDFFTNAAKSKDMNSLDQIAPRLRRDTLIRTITDYKELELTERLRFQVNAAVLAEVNLLPAWGYGKYTCSLEEVCHWMCDCVPRELFELLDTPLKPQRAAAKLT